MCKYCECDIIAPMKQGRDGYGCRQPNFCFHCGKKLNNTTASYFVKSNTLQKEIEQTVLNEYERSTEKFGAANNSPHESYAIILEEYEEAKSESNMFEINLRGFWNSVKANTHTNCCLQEMQDIAEKAAAEWVQVAAMCFKAQLKKEDKV